VGHASSGSGGLLLCERGSQQGIPDCERSSTGSSPSSGVDNSTGDGAGRELQAQPCGDRAQYGLSGETGASSGVADSTSSRRQSESDEEPAGILPQVAKAGQLGVEPRDNSTGTSGGVADSQQQGLERHSGNEPDGNKPRRVGTQGDGSTSESGDSSGVGNASGGQCEQRSRAQGDGIQRPPEHSVQEWNGPCRWHPCSDGRTRRTPVEPSLFPLADGIPGRVGMLRGAGNAIVPQVAAEFIGAYLDCS